MGRKRKFRPNISALCMEDIHLPKESIETTLMNACQQLAKNNIDNYCESCEYRFKCWTEKHE